MEILDKRNGENWRVIIANTECPHLFYPRSEIGCRLREILNEKDECCSFENCPIKEV